MNLNDPIIDQTITKKALASSTALSNVRHARLNDKLEDYLNVGRYMHAARPHFKSKKKYGQYISKELPRTKEWDAPLRSSCLWLYRALNVPGSDGYGDLLDVLGVKSLTELKTANPTKIKAYYKYANGSWDRTSPKREKTRRTPSKAVRSHAPLMPRKLLERWQIINGKSYEANLCLPTI